MLQAKAFAKINLYLEIIGKREGYHLLDSLILSINIFDIITIEKSQNLSLEIKSDDRYFAQQNYQENIIIKTVNLLTEEFNLSPKISITLDKKIPISAGLGGGSSDAATTMLLLNQFYKLNLNLNEMLTLGLRIGADVPFFINNIFSKKPTFVSGIGEVLNDFQGNYQSWVNNYYLLIANPNKAISTKQVFDLFAKTNQIQPNYRKISNYDDSNLVNLVKQHSNNLQNIAVNLAPEIATIIQFLSHQPKCLISRMSGSGASCFAIFDDKLAMDQCYQNFKRNFINFNIIKTKFC